MRNAWETIGQKNEKLLGRNEQNENLILLAATNRLATEPMINKSVTATLTNFAYDEPG